MTNLCFCCCAIRPQTMFGILGLVRVIQLSWSINIWFFGLLMNKAVVVNQLLVNCAAFLYMSVLLCIWWHTDKIHSKAFVIYYIFGVIISLYFIALMFYEYYSEEEKLKPSGSTLGFNLICYVVPLYWYGSLLRYSLNQRKLDHPVTSSDDKTSVAPLES